MKADRTMGLTICNKHSSAVTVTICYANRDHCVNAGGFIKEGWWNIAPGQCIRVYGGRLKDLNRYWFYYARIMMEPLYGRVIIVPTSLTKHSTSAGMILPAIRYVIDR